MNQYQEYLKTIFEKGVRKEDRTGVGTISYFGHQMTFNLKEGFPATTTKKLALKSMVGELLWFLRGSSDETELREITYNNKRKESIWAGNAYADYWKDKAKYEGDLGRIYGVQWRNWKGYNELYELPVSELYYDGIPESPSRTVSEEFEVDQILNALNTLKTNPDDRRIIVSAWNVADIEDDKMALPPCHCFVQFWTRELDNGKRELSAQMYQRSCDSFLGVPFNIASYSLLIHIFAEYLGMEVGEFKWVGGDCHIYLNHVEQCKKLLELEPLKLPKLNIKKDLTKYKKFDTMLNNLTVDDFELVDYEYLTTLSGEMAV